MKGKRFNRRLCYVQSILLRNINLGSLTVPLPHLYYRIVIEGRVVYTSNVAQFTLNPIWLPIEMNEPENSILNYSSSFELQVFCQQLGQDMVNQEQNYNWNLGKDPLISSFSTLQLHTTKGKTCQEGIVYSTTVDLQQLEPLGTSLLALHSLQQNTLLIELKDGFYAFPHVIQHLKTIGILSNSTTLARVPTSRTTTCFNEPIAEYDLELGIQTIEKMASLKVELNETNVKMKKIKNLTEKRLEEGEKKLVDVQNRKKRIMAIQELHDQLHVRQLLLNREKQVAEQEKKQLSRGNRVDATLEGLLGIYDMISSHKELIRSKRTEIIRVLHKIRTRQSTLVHQLRLIYPIEYAGSGEYTIRGIRLNNTDLSNRDEELVSTALGYICHLVFMLSKYLQVPLRYSIVHNSSRSFIQDLVQANAIYPLYRRGVDREKFECGVMLLHKDVEQLLSSRGLDIATGAPILACLKLLVDTEANWRPTSATLT